MIRKYLLLLLALSAVSCSADRAALESETAAVYERLLFDYCCPDNVILQASTDTAGFASGVADRFRDERLTSFSSDVRQAVADLYARSASPHPLPDSLRVAGEQRRMPADSVSRLIDQIMRDHVRRLPDTASVVLISAVGFSLDRQLAVVRITEVCGYLCGGVTLRALRRHPSGWVAAETVWSALF
jgi:hypothetical protein